VTLHGAITFISQNLLIRLRTEAGLFPGEKKLEKNATNTTFPMAKKLKSLYGSKFKLLILLLKKLRSGSLSDFYLQFKGKFIIEKSGVRIQNSE